MMFAIDEFSWAARTYQEVVDTASRDGSILIVPVGSLEQHGYHLPVGTDTLLATAMANEGAKRVSESVPVLVSPPVWTGFSPHHMPFGGTVTVEPDELVNTLEGIADSALENGFDGLLLLNGHGGNSPLVDTASGSIGKEHPEAEVLSLTYFQLAAQFIDEIRDSEVGGMGHGGEFETSLMLHLYPELVEEDRAEGTNVDEPYDNAPQDLMVGGPLSVYRPFTEYSESGVLGDPEAGTAAKGERLFSRLGDELASLLWEIHENNRDTE